MILAIYKQNGEIISCNLLKEIPKDHENAVREYNERHAESGSTVAIEKFADDSLVAFLYNDRQGRKKDFMDDLADIYNLADSLTDKLRWLEETVEEMEGRL